ncbi:MAG: hypothetical protein IT290_01730, partial [Deltaproteobacteria bacterium]|nr:hypothetical protein [Deltaproteobacteria bacterium]
TPVRVRAKLRYRHPGVTCVVTPVSATEARLEFEGEWSPVSPGQAAVFYAIEPDAEGDFEVLGGGTISSQRIAL